MTNKSTILNELMGLGSTLANHSPQNCYAVPDGYFEGLASQIMSRIKAMETTEAGEELEILSPMLSMLSKKTPYAVPAGYFENLEEKILQVLSEHPDYLTSKEEMETLSPVLNRLRNKNPYSVPAGYFENLEAKYKKQEAKIVSITGRRWYRFAAAAAIAGIIILGGLLIIGNSRVDVNKDPDKWIAKNVKKKVSSDKINDFVTLAEGDAIISTESQNTDADSAEIKELIKDVPEKEIENFLNDAVALESNDNADVLMN
jgi:hypothetical protein